jgi:outer membrane protein
MKHRSIYALIASLGLSTAAFSAEAAPSIGVVNFGNCMSESKLGKQEQASFESLKKQMTSMVEDTEKQLTELSAKFNDPEYLDGLSPEAEEELKVKFRTLNEEMNRYQNQYYQVLNQANMRIVQMMSNGISAASEQVAKDKKLTVVVNKDACFFYNTALDVTPLIVAEMDKNYEKEMKKQAAAALPVNDAAPVQGKDGK